MFQKLKKLGHQMVKTDRYHEIYNELYNQKSKRIYLKLILPPFFLFLPFVFTLFISSFLFFDNNFKKQVAFNDKEIFYNDTEIFYENFIKDTYKLKNEIKNIDNIVKIDNVDNSKDLSFKVSIKIKPNKPSNMQELELTDNLLSLENVVFPEKLNDKKLNFIKIILPIIVKQNEEILLTRSRLNEMKQFLIKNKTLEKNDQFFLNSIAKKYNIKATNIHKLDLIEDLLSSVDIIPNSLVIAQAANESGWGSSRFAKDYNALFGEYTYDLSRGVVPSNREEGKKHLIKYFDTYEKSVESYFRNINSHFAYKGFRSLRNKLRLKNSSSLINVDLLIRELGQYAEDKNYIETLSSIIRVNKLKELDNINSSFITS